MMNEKVINILIEKIDTLEKIIKEQEKTINELGAENVRRNQVMDYWKKKAEEGGKE